MPLSLRLLAIRRLLAEPPIVPNEIGEAKRIPSSLLLRNQWQKSEVVYEWHDQVLSPGGRSRALIRPHACGTANLISARNRAYSLRAAYAISTPCRVEWRLEWPAMTSFCWAASLAVTYLWFVAPDLARGRHRSMTSIRRVFLGSTLNCSLRCIAAGHLIVGRIPAY